MKTGLIFILAFLAVHQVLGQNREVVSLKPREISKRIISKKFANVPDQVRRFHAIGTINVLVKVSETGSVVSATMLSGLGHIDFMKEYVTVEVLSWKFKPLKRGGDKVSYRGLVSIPFCYGAFPKKRWC